MGGKRKLTIFFVMNSIIVVLIRPDSSLEYIHVHYINKFPVVTKKQKFYINSKLVIYIYTKMLNNVSRGGKEG